MGQSAKADGEHGARVKQPNSRHCFGCGIENVHGLQMAFYETAANEVEAEYRIPERFQGYPGIAHGGIVATMLDEIIGRSTMMVDARRFMVTASLKISYRRPVPINEPVRLVGRLSRLRGRLAKAEGELWLADGTLAAEAEATLVELPESSGAMEQLEALGWRVWPDE